MDTENGAPKVRAYLRDVQDCLDQAIEDLQVCACVCLMCLARTYALTYHARRLGGLQEISELCQHLTEAYKNYQDQKSNRTLSILTVDLCMCMYVCMYACMYVCMYV